MKRWEIKRRLSFIFIAVVIITALLFFSIRHTEAQEDGPSMDCLCSKIVYNLIKDNLESLVNASKRGMTNSPSYEQPGARYIALPNGICDVTISTTGNSVSSVSEAKNRNAQRNIQSGQQICTGTECSFNATIDDEYYMLRISIPPSPLQSFLTVVWNCK